MPRLIWVFAGRTVILLVLSWGGSIIFIIPFCFVAGQEQYATEISKGSITDTYTDGNLTLPLITTTIQEGNVSEENAYSIVKTEVVNSHDDNKSAFSTESREKDALSDTKIIDSVDVSNKAVHTETLLQRVDMDTISNSEVLEMSSKYPRQNRKSAYVKVKRTKLGRLQNKNVDNTAHWEEAAAWLLK